MKRISIIGCGGTGKSTFARRLGELTGLEVIHLDRLYWRPNWVKTDNDEWRETIEEIVAHESWITDGNYTRTMDIRLAASDTIIFLDLSRYLCLYRVLKRSFKYWKTNRPDMADGCDERFDWEFLMWIWSYPYQSKPKVEKMLESMEGKTVIRLKTRNKVKSFLNNFLAA